MSRRQAYCFNCGADLGVMDVYPGDLLTCGAADCEKEARYQACAEREQRMMDAAEDDYSRY